MKRSFLSSSAIGNEIGSDFSLKDFDFIGLYFSAHWCPPCRGFTPVLADTYNKIKRQLSNKILKTLKNKNNGNLFPILHSKSKKLNSIF